MNKFTPLHLRVLQLNWDGHSNSEIAAMTSRSLAWVSSVLSSPQAIEIMKRLEARVLDTHIQTQQIFQAHAPLAAQAKVNIMLDPNSPASVRNKAAEDLLHHAGHVPTRSVEIRRPDHIEEEFRDMSEEEIKHAIHAALDDKSDAALVETKLDPTVH